MDGDKQAAFVLWHEYRALSGSSQNRTIDVSLAFN